MNLKIKIKIIKWNFFLIKGMKKMEKRIFNYVSDGKNGDEDSEKRVQTTPA